MEKQRKEIWMLTGKMETKYGVDTHFSVHATEKAAWSKSRAVAKEYKDYPGPELYLDEGARLEFAVERNIIDVSKLKDAYPAKRAGCLK